MDRRDDGESDDPPVRVVGDASDPPHGFTIDDGMADDGPVHRLADVDPRIVG